MKRSLFLSHLFRSQISLLAIIMLIAPAWKTPAFRGEIHDAARLEIVRVISWMVSASNSSKPIQSGSRTKR